MRISEMFPSNFLSAADFPTETTVTITGIKIEEVGADKEQKHILYFDGIKKGLVLNKTNAKMIASLYGDDANECIGEAITLYATMADFKGQSVPALRVKPPLRKKAAAAQAGGSQKKISDSSIDGDEIPF